MTRTITLDGSNDRLVFLNIGPDQACWDELWHSRLTRYTIKRRDWFVAAENFEVLGKGARLVDAGYGIAATVSGLQDAGTRFFLLQKVDQT